MMTSSLLSFFGILFVLCLIKRLFSTKKNSFFYKNKLGTIYQQCKDLGSVWEFIKKLNRMEWNEGMKWNGME